MLISQLNRDDGEKIFISAQNATGATVSVGTFLCFDWRNNSSIGVAVIKPTTSTVPMFAGVVAHKQPSYKDWPANSFGLIQVYGVHGSVAYNVGAASLSCAGQFLIPVNAQYSGQTNAPGFGAWVSSAICMRGAFLMTNDLSGDGRAAAFVKAL